MFTKQHSRGSLWTGLAVALTLTSAAAAQLQGSDLAVKSPGSPVAGGVVASTTPIETSSDALIVQEWFNLGFALPGVLGEPNLKGSGLIQAGERSKIVLKDAAPLAPAVLFVALDSTPMPFKGGTLVPGASVLTLVMATNYEGGIELPISASANVPAGFDLYMQFAIADAAAVHGVALSNAIQTSTH